MVTTMCFAPVENARIGRRSGRRHSSGRQRGHVDLPRARAAAWPAACRPSMSPPGELMLKQPDAEATMRPAVTAAGARPSLGIALEMAAIALQAGTGGRLALCRTGRHRSAIAAGRFAAVLHLEGCEPIGTDLDELDVLYAAGLRSLGPVWSRNNIFGHGVPFRLSAQPRHRVLDSLMPGAIWCGPAIGCGILVDLSHITEKGFWDVAAITDQPLVASHSNVTCHHARGPKSDRPPARCGARIRAAWSG